MYAYIHTYVYTYILTYICIRHFAWNMRSFAVLRSLSWSLRAATSHRGLSADAGPRPSDDAAPVLTLPGAGADVAPAGAAGKKRIGGSARER
jgi:hypothetical protein